jgi:peptide-methionine (R)-S-oxide reductase
MADKIVKTDQEWKEQLSKAAFHVARKHGTERSYTGEYHDCKDTGVYKCICCGQALFSSETKFDSGTGWPSFLQPIEAANVEEQEDRGFFSVRTEVHCSRCDAHLGHVFNDGPEPTGLRYCMNSVSLNLERDSEA